MLEGISLAEVSPVGFGCYRVEMGVPDHHAALAHALSMGCTLIDTASSYGDGRSEQLVGDVLRAQRKHPVFVVTKAGYVTPAAEAMMRAEGVPLAGLDAISEESKHSLSPDILRAQVAISLKRLRRNYVDALLLHNPEHFFDCVGPERTHGAYYRQVREAFSFLEECVAAGTIRYYGVSSNTLATTYDHERYTNLSRLLAAAQSVASDHHFRIVEFPFNLVETEAAERGVRGCNLLDEIKANGLVSIGNRPLNGRRGEEIVRLATYEDVATVPAHDEPAATYSRCVALVQDRLATAHPSHEIMDFNIMRFMRDNWRGIEHPDTVDTIFRRHFYPFIEALWDGPVPHEMRDACAALHRCARRCAQQRLNGQGEEVRAECVRAGIIARDDPRDLAAIACDFCLRSGLDHVVVGMRTVGYVESLRSLIVGPRRETGAAASWTNAQEGADLPM